VMSLTQKRGSAAQEILITPAALTRRNFILISGDNGSGKTSLTYMRGVEALQKGYKVVHCVLGISSNTVLTNYTYRLMDIYNDVEKVACQLDKLRVVVYPVDSDISYESLTTCLLGYKPDVMIIDNDASACRLTTDTREFLFNLAQEKQIVIMATLNTTRQLHTN